MRRDLIYEKQEEFGHLPVDNKKRNLTFLKNFI